MLRERIDRESCQKDGGQKDIFLTFIFLTHFKPSRWDSRQLGGSARPTIRVGEDFSVTPFVWRAGSGEKRQKNAAGAD
jgi:hypothetical protein